MKNAIITLVVIILVGFGVYFWKQNVSDTALVIQKKEAPLPEAKVSRDEKTTARVEQNEPSANTAPVDKTKTVIGKSVEGRDIIAYHYGQGDKELLFVGGIHGGYEWNTALVAYEAMDYFEKNPDIIPGNIKVTVIPVLNPDGLYKTIGKEGRFSASEVPTSEGAAISGRYNANAVDLNRNFDCDWQSSGVWRTTKVSGGNEAFSEPESRAIKDYAEARIPLAAVVWYSSAGGVFSSNCHDGVLAETEKITNLYAKASGYSAHKTFNFYEITGDMVNWFAKEKIPAISVLLTNHTDTEWSKNQAGIEALLRNYAQ